MKIQKKQEIEFFGTKTGNANSIALGYATETKNFGEVAVGVMNKSTAAKDPNSSKGVCADPDATLFSVGCGGSGERKNALEVKGDGSVIIPGENGDINVADKIKQVLDTDASIELVKSTDSDLQYTLMVNNESRGSINIPKDQFLKNVTYDTEAKRLVFTFVTLDEEEHVERISINDLKDVYTAGNGINIDNNVISADFSSVEAAISDEKTQRETTDNEIKSTLDTKANKTEIPTNVSQLANDSDFITDDVVYDACDNVIKQAVTIDNNNNINGLFVEDGSKIDISNETDFSIGLGCNNGISGEYNIAIGQNINVGDTNDIAIGTSIISENASINIGDNISNKGIYNIIIGSNELDLNEGCVSIGYLARKKNIDTVTYQIGGYSKIAAAQEDKRYNIEETLDNDNDHKKYIYGVGGYNGLTTDNAKSLQEVLDSKLETIDSTSNTVLYEDYNGTIKVGQDNVFDKPSIFVYERWNEDTDAVASGVIINTNSVEVKDESANASLAIHHSGITSMNGDNVHAYTTDGGIFDLTTKADASAIPTKLSQLTNDANFITSYTETDPVWTREKTNYYTKTEIDGKGYLTAHQSLDGYAKKTEIPNVSTKADLVDGKLKAEQLPKLNNITAATTTEDMITKFNDLLADLKAKGYMTADITA